MRKILAGAIGVVLAACGASASSGGTIQTHGGAEGTECNPQYFSGGCYGLDQMKCAADASATQGGKWQKLGSCTANVTYCEEKYAGTAISAVCTPLASSATPTADTVSGGDVSGDTGGSKDTGPSVGEIKACVQSKCASQLSACMADSACAAAVGCNINCADAACRDKCPSISGDNAAGMALLGCMMQQNCIPTTQPTDTCGDGTCGSSETPSSCPQDCKTTANPVCGDGKCEGSEVETCPADCQTGPKCGNGTCESGESNSTCPQDCPAANKCGNGTCDSGETKSTCPQDCGSTTTAKCGDGVCASGESCAMDCSTAYAPTIQCGWSACKSQMTACQNSADCVAFFNCAASCTDCNQSCLQECVMGPGIKAQSQITAISDCAKAASCPNPCPTSGPVCGNGTCESGETASNCASDCGTPANCGNGTCESGETAASCPIDCGSGGGHFCDSHCGSSGNGCYCDASCKKYGDCCTAAGAAPATKTYSCTGSTCADCK